MAGRGKRDVGKERFWRRVLRLWRRSGLSVRDFCAEQGLTEPLFYAWRRVIAERDLEMDAPAFVPVRVVDPPMQALEVVLARGRVVRVPRGFDAHALRQLLALLEEERPC